MISPTRMFIRLFMLISADTVALSAVSIVFVVGIIVVVLTAFTIPVMGKLVSSVMLFSRLSSLLLVFCLRISVWLVGRRV